MTKAILISILLGVSTLLFCVLYLDQCSVSKGKQDTIDTLVVANKKLDKKVAELKDTLSAQYSLLDKRNGQIGKLEKQVQAGNEKASRDSLAFERKIELKNQVIDQLAEDNQKALAIAASLKRGYITKEQAEANSKKTGPAFGSVEADKNIAKLGQEADQLKQGLSDTSKSLGQREEELRQARELEAKMRTAVIDTRVVVVNQLIKVVHKRQALRGPKGWFKGGQKKLLDEQAAEFTEADSQLEKILNKKQ